MAKHKSRNYGVLSKAIRFFREMVKNYGGNFFCYLTYCYFGFIGASFALTFFNQLPMYKNVMNLDVIVYQMIYLVAVSPFSMKPLVGIVSDLFPFLGFYKSSYIFVASLSGSASLLALYLIKEESYTVTNISLMMFLVMAEVAITDLLIEGEFSNIMLKKKIKDQNIIHWAWLSRITGQLIGGIMQGILVKYNKIKIVYLVAFALSVPVVILTSAGFINEKYVDRWYRKLDIKKLKKETKMFCLALLAFLASLGMIIVNWFGIKYHILIYSIVVSLVMTIACVMALPPTLAKCTFYVFASHIFYIRINSVLDYWYTASKECVPNGPNFNLMFYLTETQVISCITSIITIILLIRFARSSNYRIIFGISTGIQLLACLWDLSIIYRVNKKLEIPDKIAYIFGDGIIMDVASIMSKVPTISLVTRLTNSGYQSTILAIVAGYMDIGKGVSISIGVLLIDHFKISFKKEPCQIENLGLLVLISHFLLPVCASGLIILIPNARMDDLEFFEMVKNCENYKAMGALWRKSKNQTESNLNQTSEEIYSKLSSTSRLDSN